MVPLLVFKLMMIRQGCTLYMYTIAQYDNIFT